MIIPNSALDHPCDACELPIEGVHVQWKLPRVTLLLHPTCAHALATRMRSNVYRLYRIQEEQAKAAEQVS